MHFGPVPGEIRVCQHFMKLAEDHDERNILVAYYARMSAIQLAMKVVPGTKSPEVSKYLMSIMDWLETAKKDHAQVDGIMNETVAQAVLEEYMFKLYTYAYNCDCTGKFNKNMVKAYYTASLLCEILMQFGKLSEDIETKYNTSRYRATYLHNVLKAGRTPIGINVIHVYTDEEEAQYVITLEELNRRRAERGEPPISDEPTEEELEARRKREAAREDHSNPEFEAELQNLEQSIIDSNPNPNKFEVNFSEDDEAPNVSSPLVDIPTDIPKPFFDIPKPVFDISKPLVVTPKPVELPPKNENSIAILNPDQIEKAAKYCKWASSALNYDDMKSAIDNLERALHLCKFGEEKQ